MSDSPQVKAALNARSRALVGGANRAGARAMLKATGLTDNDLAKPLIGIANTWTEIGPCNFHLLRFMPQIIIEGEWSFIFLRGAYSHAVLNARHKATSALKKTWAVQ